MHWRTSAFALGLLLYGIASGALLGTVLDDDLLTLPVLALVALALGGGTAVLGVSRPSWTG